MSYIIHRVFCATTDDLEPERQSFYTAVASVNENVAMPRGILFAPASISVNMPDKRPFQPVIADNIRSCRYYIQVFGSHPWPPHRDFASDYALALTCAADPAQPMCEVAALIGPPVGKDAPNANPEANACLAHRVLKYSTVEEFGNHCRDLLTLWLETIVRA